MSDADTIAAELESAIEAERLRQRAPELALRVAAYEAGVPLDHPVGQMFLRQYDGRADADDLAVAWHRQVLDAEPPVDVTERIADREREARIAAYRAALEPSPEEDEENAGI